MWSKWANEIVNLPIEILIFRLIDYELKKKKKTQLKKKCKSYEKLHIGLIEEGIILFFFTSSVFIIKLSIYHYLDEYTINYLRSF